MSMCFARFQQYACTLLIVTVCSVLSFSQNSHVIANSTPRLPAHAQIVGPADASKTISITVWLKQRNKSELDEVVRQMYRPGSPSYHRWLTRDQYNARYAPSAQDAKAVSDFLTSRGLKVSSVDKANHYVVAEGRIGNVQSALHVQLSQVRVDGELRRVNMSDPIIEGAAGAAVASVQGLTDRVFKPHSKRPIDPDTHKPFAAVPLATATPNGAFFSGNCLRSPQSRSFTTNGGFPKATYKGNRYGQDIDSAQPNLPPCGYDPAELQSAYGLTSLFQKGWDGSGQTVVIVDAFGSPTIRKDANTFSKFYGLPALNASNFQVIKVGVATGCTPADGCDPASWVEETTLDVEYVHAVAPKANIILIEAKDNTFTNLDLAVFLAASNQLGSVISNSYGAPEVLLSPAELLVQDSNNQLAAALGASANYSTGDDGDYFVATGGAFRSVSSPAVSPYATAIGGTSLFLNSAKTKIKLQTGWGNNETRIVNTTAEGSTPVVPPLNLGFVFGAGGGTSEFFAKPSYQKSLPGAGRSIPDISYVGDPFTGVEIILTDPASGGLVVEVIGGTSLSCPMFSGMWAIANQAAGAPLGQAAPLLYTLPTGAITDVIDASSTSNVTGTIKTSATTSIAVSADDLAAPLENTTSYFSAMYNSPFSTRWFVLTFGTDSSLTTGVGWDNVTGLGTPNGLTFVKDVVAAAP
jgi:subtilase family serine protease